MLLCTPPTHASSQKVHDAWSAHHDMISGNGDSYSSNWNPQQRGPVSRTSHDDNTTDYSHLPIERVSSKNTLSSTGLNHNHNPFSPDHESWQSSNLSYRSLSDVSPQLISNIPFTPHRTGSPVVTSSWCPQDAIETATWSEAPGIAPFVTTIEPGYIDWTPIDQITTPWSATLSDSFQSPISIAPVSVAVPAPTPVPAPAPYRQQSFWAYKPQGIIESPAYAGMEMNAEIPYPTIYTTTSPQITSPLIHPAFQTNPAVVSDLSRVIMTAEFQTVDENSLPMSKQSISSTRTQPQLRLNTSSTNNNTHHHLPGAISKKKTTPKGGRVGPLTITQREKVEDMRTYGACWRCRKYKKPCNGPGICNTCVTSGFRVWPSALGCRRGDFDSFAFGMIPTHSEQIVGQIVSCYPKPAGWRKLSKIYRSEMTLSQSAINGDRFEQLMLKVQATQLTGPGVMELLEIACNLQRGLVKESRVLANTLKGLSHSCDFYSCFVATDESPTILRGRFDMINIFTHNRKALLTTLSSFLNSCLTGRMKDWLPTFLSANFIVFTFVMLSDAAVMVPEHFRDKLWPSIRAIIMDFRGILYPMAQDLLSALGKGSKLLHMQCWSMVETPSEIPGEESTWERNREGMKILDGDIAIFDGLKALQTWLERFGPLMRGDVWYSAAPYTLDVLPVCSWERMFDFSPRG